MMGVEVDKGSNVSTQLQIPNYSALLIEINEHCSGRAWASQVLTIFIATK